MFQVADGSGDAVPQFLDWSGAGGRFGGIRHSGLLNDPLA
jgi:hypothetical protein